MKSEIRRRRIISAIEVGFGGGGGSSIIESLDEIPGLVWNPDIDALPDGFISNVTGMTDRDITVTPPTSGSRPSVVSGVLGSHKAIRFSNVAHRLRGLSADWNFLHQQENTVGMLIKLSTTGTNRFLFHSGGGNTTAGRMMRFITDNRYEGHIYTGGGANTDLATFSVHTFASEEWLLLIIRNTPALKVYLDVNSLEESASEGNVTPYSGAASELLPTWFASATGTLGSLCDCVEWFCFDRDITDAEMVQVRDFFNQKHPSLALPEMPVWANSGATVTQESVVTLDAPVSNPDYHMASQAAFWGGLTNIVFAFGSGHANNLDFTLQALNWNGSFSSAQLFKAADPSRMVATPTAPFLTSTGKAIRIYMKQLLTTSQRHLHYSMSDDAVTVGLLAATWGPETLFTSDYPDPGMVDGGGTIIEHDGYLVKLCYARTDASSERAVVMYRVLVSSLTDKDNLPEWEFVGTVLAASTTFAWEEPALTKNPITGLVEGWICSEGTIAHGVYKIWCKGDIFDMSLWSAPRYAVPSYNTATVTITPRGTYVSGGRRVANPAFNGRAFHCYSRDGFRSHFVESYLDAETGREEGSGIVYDPVRQKIVHHWSSEVISIERTVRKGTTFVET